MKTSVCCESIEAVGTPDGVILGDESIVPCGVDDDKNSVERSAPKEGLRDGVALGSSKEGLMLGGSIEGFILEGTKMSDEYDVC